METTEDMLRELASLYKSKLEVAEAQLRGSRLIVAELTEKVQELESANSDLEEEVDSLTAQLMEKNEDEDIDSLKEELEVKEERIIELQDELDEQIRKNELLQDTIYGVYDLVKGEMNR